MWSVTFICVVTGIVPFPTLSQEITPEVPSLTQSCTNGEQMATCKDVFFNATHFIQVGNKEAFCKSRADYSICLEKAVCTCMYAGDDPLLENAYKDIMTNNYHFTNESCQSFSTGYIPASGISCDKPSQNSKDHFQIIQNTADQPFITSLKQNCSALHVCFEQRDKDFKVAMFNKSLSAYCRDYDVFLKCFEDKVCKCNMQVDQAMLLVANVEKQAFTSMCSIITGTGIVITEIACGGACSLSEPGVTCNQEFQKHITDSSGEKDLCRHLATHAQCYDRIVCQCGLHQKQNVYTAISIIKYTFEVKSACGRFPDIVFPSNKSGFPCQGDTPIQAKDKVLTLNTHQADYVVAEEQVCHGVAACYAKFDTVGSTALYNKDLKAFCLAMNEQITCLERTTCACGTLKTRFSSILMTQRAGLNAVCSEGVIEISLPLNCVDQSLCTSYSPKNCSNILNRQPQPTEDAQRVLCQNYVDYGQCIKDISCSCHLVKNGSSNATIEIYKMLNRNAAAHDSMGCLLSSDKNEHGLSCIGEDSIEKSKRKLNLTWSQSSEKAQLVTVCPAVAACFDHDDAINEEALYAIDYKRVCRNQLNTLKCMEKAFCKCELNKDTQKSTDFHEKIISHNEECSRYAPFGNMIDCKEMDICSTARITDVCFKRLTRTANSTTTTCIDYSSYLLCVFDVACTCDLVKNGTDKTAELLYKNVTEVLYLMIRESCSFKSVPETFLQKGFECYDMTTAFTVQMGTLKLSFAKGQEVQQLTGKCSEVGTCANLYDKALAEALNVKNFEDVCRSRLNMTQCSQHALNKCNLTITTEAVAFNALLASKYSGCDAGNATEASDFEGINFAPDVRMDVNNSQLQVESARGGCITSISSSIWGVTAALFLMASVSTFRQ